MYYVRAGDLDDKIYQGDVFEEFPCHFLHTGSFKVLRADAASQVGHPYAEDALPDPWREEELVIVRAKRYRIILVSQSCDIHEEEIGDLCPPEEQQYRHPMILYAPVIPVTDLGDYRKLLQQIRSNPKAGPRQNLTSAFFLPAHPDGHFPDSIALLTWICSVRKERANRFRTFAPKRRLSSLKSPYREAFAHKFASIYSRVALPTDKVYNDNCA